jgi:hypothetical protein
MVRGEVCLVYYYLNLSSHHHHYIPTAIATTTLPSPTCSSPELSVSTDAMAPAPLPQFQQSTIPPASYVLDSS